MNILATLIGMSIPLALIIYWGRTPKPDPASDAAWGVVEACLIEHPEDWKDLYGNGCVLANKKAGLFMWIANGVRNVSVSTSASDARPAGTTTCKHTVPPPAWQQRLWDAYQTPGATTFKETLVDRVREAYVQPRNGPQTALHP